jgi:hypothetical protein
MQDVQIPLRLNIPEAQFTEHLLTWEVIFW